MDDGTLKSNDISGAELQRHRSGGALKRHQQRFCSAAEVHSEEQRHRLRK